MTLEKDVENYVAREDANEPLIINKLDGDKNGSIVVSLLSTGVAVWGSFQYGTCIGYSSPTQESIRSELGLSLSEFSLFGSILTIGAMVGAITCGPITDHLGRKWAMRLSSIVCLVGWLAIYFAQGALLLYVGRFCTGCGIGCLSYVVPVFIAEISPPNLRGGLTIINQVMICAGVSLIYILGILVGWRTLTLIGILPCIILLVGLFFIPESPRWLAKMGHRKEFEYSLQKLRGKDADISREYAEIRALENLPSAGPQDLFQRRYARTIIVGIGLMVLQQLSGINAINFYSSETFVEAGFSSGSTGTIGLALIQVPFTIIGALLMDRSGRKPLLMVSAAGTCLGTFLAGFSFYLKGQGMFANWTPMLALVGILVYMASFAIGVGGIPWAIMSEIFPINIKGAGGSLVTLSNWFSSWVVSFSYNFLMHWSSSGTLFLFSAASLVMILFVAEFVPETKGRTLEEIQSSLIKE